MTIRVLVADDQALVRGSFRILVDTAPDLTSVGEAATGGEAVRLARRERPDVVLMDIRMPGIDGHTVLEHLRGSPRPPSVIIVSGNHQEDEAQELLQRGAVDYVMKPIDFSYLEQAIVAAAGVAPPEP